VKKLATIDQLAAECFATIGDLTLPVDIVSLARDKGLIVTPYPLGELSGVLYIEEGKGKIGYDPKLKLVQIRFTVAHLLGHFILHNHKSELFIDRQFKYSENGFLSVQPKTLEMEANEFAIRILIPEICLKEMGDFSVDFGDDESVKSLAKKFGVSYFTLCHRLINLKLR
jgi:Zn-dependent peptidase ImmA (M78 family)